MPQRQIAEKNLLRGQHAKRSTEKNGPTESSQQKPTNRFVRKGHDPKEAKRSCRLAASPLKKKETKKKKKKKGRSIPKGRESIRGRGWNSHSEMEGVRKMVDRETLKQKGGGVLVPTPK